MLGLWPRLKGGGLNDFSTFIRSLIAAERKKVERKTNEKKD